MQRARSACNPGAIDSNNFRVPDRYRFQRHLGSGSYGTVACYYDSARSREVAIKRVRRVFDNFLVLRRTLREIRLMRHFRHPNLMRIHKVLPLDETGDLYLSLELMDCDLDTLIHARQVALSDHQVRRFASQMLLGLLQLHSAHVLHRDLKPANIFVRLSRGQVKIGDLGLSRGVAVDGETLEATHPSDEQLTEYVVTRWYRAPEVLLARSKYGPPVDVWSVGCILYEMWARKALFPGKNSYDQLKRVFAVLGMPSDGDVLWVPSESRPLLQRCAAVGGPGSGRSEAWESFCNAANSSEGTDLVLRMTTFDPGQRLSVEGCLQHDYLSPFNSERDRACAKEVSPADVTYDRFYDGLGRGGEQAALLQLGRMLRREALEERVPDVTPDHSPAPHSARCQRSQSMRNTQPSCEDMSARAVDAATSAATSLFTSAALPVRAGSAQRLPSQATEAKQRMGETAVAALAGWRSESYEACGVESGRRSASKDSSRMQAWQRSKLLDHGDSGCSSTRASSNQGSATSVALGGISLSVGAMTTSCGETGGHFGWAGGGGGGGANSMSFSASFTGGGAAGERGEFSISRRLPNPVLSSASSLGAGSASGQLSGQSSASMSNISSTAPAPSRRRSSAAARATARALPEPPAPCMAHAEASRAPTATIASSVFAAAASAAQQLPTDTARRVAHGGREEPEATAARSNSLSRLALKRRSEKAIPSSRGRASQAACAAALPTAERSAHTPPPPPMATHSAGPTMLPAPPRVAVASVPDCGGYPDGRRNSDAARSSSRHSQPGTSHVGGQRYPPGASRHPYRESEASYLGIGLTAAAAGSPRASAPPVPVPTQAPAASSMPGGLGHVVTSAVTVAGAGGTGSTRFELPMPPGETGCTPLYQGGTFVLGGNEDQILPYASRPGVRASRTLPGRAPMAPAEKAVLPAAGRPSGACGIDERRPYDDAARGSKASARHQDVEGPRAFPSSSSSRAHSSRNTGGAVVVGCSEGAPLLQYQQHSGLGDKHIADPMPSARRHESSVPRVAVRALMTNRNASVGSEASDHSRAGSLSARRRRPTSHDELDFAVLESAPVRRQTAGMPSQRQTQQPRRATSQSQAARAPRQPGEIPLPPWLEASSAMPELMALRSSRRHEADTSPMPPSAQQWPRRASSERPSAEERSQWRSLQHCLSNASFAVGRAAQRRPSLSARVSTDASFEKVQASSLTPPRRRPRPSS